MIRVAQQERQTTSGTLESERQSSRTPTQSLNTSVTSTGSVTSVNLSRYDTEPGATRLGHRFEPLPNGCSSFGPAAVTTWIPCPTRAWPGRERLGPTSDITIDRAKTYSSSGQGLSTLDIHRLDHYDARIHVRTGTHTLGSQLSRSRQTGVP